MKLYTIKYKDTWDKIVAPVLSRNVTADSIWDSPINKIMRAYWPKGSNTTRDELPIGYSVVLPQSNHHTGKASKEEGNPTKFVVKKPLKHLRLKIKYYNNYDYYMWSSYDWKSKFLKKHFKTKAEIDEVIRAQSAAVWQSGSVSAGLSGLNEPPRILPSNKSSSDDKYYYYDRNSKSYVETTTPLKEFKVVTGKTMEIPEEANWGHVRGNNSNVRPIWKLPNYNRPTLDEIDKVIHDPNDDRFGKGPSVQKDFQENYVYLFHRPLNSKETSCTFEAVYKAGVDSYQEIDLKTGSPKGPETKTIEKDNFFNPDDPYNIELYKEYYVYVSRILLAEDTVTNSTYGLVKSVPKVGTMLPQAPWIFKQQKFCTNAKQLHDAYRDSGTVASAVDKISYPYQLIQDHNQEFILNLHVPDIESEAIRLNFFLADQHREYVEWQESKGRTYESFLFGIINYLKEQNKLSGNELNLDEYDSYEFRENFELRSRRLRWELAAIDMVAFLEDLKFLQLIRNYGHKIKDKDGDKYEYRLHKILLSSHRDLRLTQAGHEYFENMVKAPESYYNCLLKGLVADKEKGKLPSLLRNNNTPSFNKDLLNVFRKSSDIALLWVNEYIPAVCKKLLDTKEKRTNLLEGFKDALDLKLMPPNLKKRLELALEQRVKSVKTRRINLSIKLLDVYSKSGDVGVDQAIADIKKEEFAQDMDAWRKTQSKKYSDWQRRLKEYNQGKRDTKPKMIKFGKSPEKKLNPEWTKKARIETKFLYETKIGLGAVSTLLEGVNLAVTISEVYADGKLTMEERFQVIGAVLDLSVSVLDDNKTILSRIFSSSRMLQFGKLVPVLSIASCLIDAMMETKNLIVMLNSDEPYKALGHGLSAVGYTALAYFTYGAITAVGAEAVLAATLGSIAALAVIVIGALILYFVDTEVQEWAKTGRFGIKKTNKPLEQQFKEIIEWLCKPQISCSRWFTDNSSLEELDDPRAVRTEYLVTISPRAHFTKEVEIVLKNFKVNGATEKHIDKRWSDRLESFEGKSLFKSYSKNEIRLNVDLIFDTTVNSPHNYKKEKLAFDWGDMYLSVIPRGISFELRLWFEFFDRISYFSGGVTIEIGRNNNQKMGSEQVKEKGIYQMQQFRYYFSSLDN